jgi:hypothetical protein
MSPLAPLFCPYCGRPDPKQVSAFQVPGKDESTVNVYRCDCGYVFQVVSYLIPNRQTQVRTSGRPQLRFYTRDLVWLTVVVALVCGLGVQYRAALELRRMERADFDHEIRLCTEEQERLRTEIAKLERQLIK